MPIPALVAALGTALLGAHTTKTAEVAVSPLAAKAKDEITKKLKLGKYAGIQRAIEGAREDVLAQSQTDEEHELTIKVLDTLLSNPAALLLSDFTSIAVSYTP